MVCILDICEKCFFCLYLFNKVKFFFLLVWRVVVFGMIFDWELLLLKVLVNCFGNEFVLWGVLNCGFGCYYNVEVVEKYFFFWLVFN